MADKDTMEWLTVWLVRAELCKVKKLELIIKKPVMKCETRLHSST